MLSLVGTASAALSADLAPPFTGVLRFWDVGGSAVTRDDRIIIVPAIQSYAGSAWCRLPVPAGNWSVSIELNVTSVTGGGSFAFWVIDDQGADGPLFGGPTNFYGICAAGAVVGHKMKFVLLQSTSLANSFSDSTLKFDSFTRVSDEPITFSISFDHDVRFYRVNVEEHILSRRAPRMNISKAWFGITAINSDRTSHIDLLSVRFHGFGPIENWEHEELPFRFPHRTIINRPPGSNLRSADFDAMKAHLAGLRSGSAGAASDANSLLGAISEFGRVLEHTATYADLSALLLTTVGPYADRWYKQTLKMSARSSEGLKLLRAAFNATELLIDGFNQTISQTIAKTDLKLMNITDLVVSSLVDRVTAVHTAARPSGSILLAVLSTISLIEVGLVGGFLLLRRVD